MNLDEIKSELNKLDTKLSELKQQKHQLFSQLKKVLHEDDLRRRQWNANHALFSSEHPLAMAQAVQMSGGQPNPMFAQQMPHQFNTPVSTPSMHSFYGGSNGQAIRSGPAPTAYQPKFNPQHLIQSKGPPISGPPPPPSINSAPSNQRSLKRPHEQSVVSSRGSSPPVVQSSQSHYKPHSVPVTYTPSIPSESRHPYPVMHSQHWSPHQRHPFGWSQ